MLTEWIRRLLGIAELSDLLVRQSAMQQQLLAQQLEITGRLLAIVERQLEVANIEGAVEPRPAEPEEVVILWDANPDDTEIN